MATPPEQKLADTYDDAYENTAFAFVDFDNLRNHAKQNGLDFSLDQIIAWITPESTGIDRIVRVEVFDTRVRWYKRSFRYGVNLANRNNFYVHTYSRNQFEPGYPDEEIRRRAWDNIGNYHTAVFISNDNIFAKFAEELRSGLNPYTGIQLPQDEIPECLLLSSFYGKREDWIKSAQEYVYNLDSILHAQGIRGPVNRPTQP